MSSYHPRSYRVKVLLGVTLSALFLWLAVKEVDYQRLVNSIQQVEIRWIVGCWLALSSGLILRAMRWWAIGSFPSVHLLDFSRATSLGTLSNFLLPARAGEFVKIITAARSTREPFTRVLSSAIGDRLIDMLVLLSIASALYMTTSIGEVLDRRLFVFFAIGIMIIGLIALYIRFSGRIDALIGTISGAWLARWTANPEILLSEMRLHLRQLPANAIQFNVWIYTALILICDYSAIAAMLNAFTLQLPIAAPLILWVFLAVGSALPSAPGYIGIYQLASVWALSMYSVAPAVSVALATVLQLTTLTTAILLTSALYVKHGLKRNCDSTTKT